MARRPAGAFVNGILGAIIVPPAMFLLIATGIGVFVLPFAWLGIAFGTAVGLISLYRYCGAQLGFSGQPMAALIAGFLVFAVLYMVPVVGFLAWAIVMMFGFGVALTAWGETRREKRAAEVARRQAAAAAPAAAPASPPPAFTTPASTTTTPASATPPFTLGEPLDAPPHNPPPLATNAPANDVGATNVHVGVTAGFTATPATTTEPPPATPTPPAPPSTPVVPPAPTSAPSATLPIALLDQERADFLSRFAATLLDLITVVAAVNFLRIDDYFMQVWFLYHLGFWAWRATTLGGAVMGLRIVRLDGRKVDVGVALVRVLGAVMSLLPFGLGFLWVFWDPEKQSWHDKIAGTVIVRLRRGQALI